MKELDRFNIDIFKLSNSEHNYQFEIGNSFFLDQPDSIVNKGKGRVEVILEKNERFINVRFHLGLSVELECDRTLEPFDFDIYKEENLIFKFGEEEAELDDNIIVIHRDRQRINLAQYIYEFISISVPMKKLHPRFGEEVGEDEMIYTSSEAQKSKDGSIDPRWEKLKKLK